MSGPAQNIHNIYDPLWEHDACGIGAVVNLKGTPSRGRRRAENRGKAGAPGR